MENLSDDPNNDDDTVTTQFVFYFLAIAYTILTIITLYKLFPYLLRSKRKDPQKEGDSSMKDHALPDFDTFSERLIIEKSP